MGGWGGGSEETRNVGREKTYQTCTIESDLFPCRALGNCHLHQSTGVEPGESLALRGSASDANHQYDAS
jgi:hypothetical protein